VTIAFLDKAEAGEILPTLYRIFHDNMSPILHTDEPFPGGREGWLAAVGPALEKAPRQILLLRDGEKIAGFFQYYVNGGVFMMEEIQFREEYRGTGLFEKLYRYLVGIIPEETEYVEAYVHKTNPKSMAVLNHLGLTAVEDEPNESLLHYRGRYESLVRRYGSDI